MSLEFNIGELSARIRRALGSRGRIPLDLDERCTINVQSIDLDRAPWRNDGARWAAWITIGAVPGLFSNLVISSGQSTATLVIDQLIFRNQVANQTWLGLVQPQPSVRAMSPYQVHELDQPRTAGAIAAVTAKGAASYASLPVAANTLSAIGNQLDVLSQGNATPGSELAYNLELTIQPGWELLLEQATQNVALQIYASGRAFSQQVPTP